MRKIVKIRIGRAITTPIITAPFAALVWWVPQWLFKDDSQYWANVLGATGVIYLYARGFLFYIEYWNKLPEDKQEEEPNETN